MNAVIIIILVLLGVLVIFALIRMRELDSRVDDIYNKVFLMQGDIEEHTSRMNAHYADMAQLNANIEKVAQKVSELHEKENTDEPAKEVEIELESLIEGDKEEEENMISELDQRRIEYAKYRKQGMGIKEAGVAVGVSHSTAKRYEQWRQSNKK